MTDKRDFWEQHRGIIRSRRGGWKIGQGVFSHGFNMMEELVGRKSYFQVMILQATGRLLERKYADRIEAIFICMSWPDPRIWCNQIGALGGTLRASVVTSTCLGILAGDSTLYGQKPLLAGVDFISQALKNHKAGWSAEKIVAEECKKHRGKPLIMGYARPIAKGDERVTAIERYNRENQLETGEHLELAYQIDRVMTEQFSESININGYSSAIMADHGFTPQQTYQLAATVVASGVTACYLDALERPAESFLPQRCEDIDYQGPPLRPVPAKD